MSESNTSTSKVDDPTPGEHSGESTQGDDPGAQSVSPEVQAKLKRLNWLEGENRTSKKQIEELTNRLQTVESEKNSGKKSELEQQVQQAHAKIKELTEEMTRRDGVIRDYRVKSQVRDVAIKERIVSEKAFEAFWAIEGTSFDEVEDGGVKKVGLKSAPYEDLKSALTQLVQKHEYFAANPRLPGTGEPKKGEVDPGKTKPGLPKDWATQTQDQKKEFFKNMTDEQRKEFRKEFGF